MHFRNKTFAAILSASAVCTPDLRPVEGRSSRPLWPAAGLLGQMKMIKPLSGHDIWPAGGCSMRVMMIAVGSLCIGLMGCSSNLAPREDPVDQRTVGRSPERLREQRRDSVFGEGGVSFRNGSVQLGGSSLFGSDDDDGERLPVNRFLWQASLETLSFLPLASTDPFSGVIATDWGAAQNAPGERFKVTAYLVSGSLSASSLRVAVFREVRGDEGAWLPATVDPDTPREIEDAILSRARQIRMAENGIENTG
ncbi:MAG: DUF3576 domain-containing protein [Pseudomonadota bacterium]